MHKQIAGIFVILFFGGAVIYARTSAKTYKIADVCD